MTIRELSAKHTQLYPEYAEVMKDPEIKAFYDLIGDLDQSYLPHILELCESIHAEKSH